MNHLFSREDSLKEKFNKLFNAILKTERNPKDYYSLLSVSDLVAMKNALSDINNILTLKVTLAFVDFLEKEKRISYSDAERIKEIVNNTSANANGFDLEDETCHILAEVKCNDPCIEGKTLFGSSQIDGIRKDLNGLENGKRKSDIKDTSGYYRFMVVLDTGESVHKAIDKLSKKKNVTEFLMYPSSGSLEVGKTYIVFIPSSQV